MNLYSALKLAEKAREEASKRGEKLAISVFDASSTLLAFLNMDIEETECVEYAQRKAVTALRTDSDTLVANICAVRTCDQLSYLRLRFITKGTSDDIVCRFSCHILSPQSQINVLRSPRRSNRTPLPHRQT